MHVEVQIIPVSGVDRSKQFYQRLGWPLAADAAPLDGRARLGRGRADRLRHRRSPRRPGRPRDRRERDLARPAVLSRGPAARSRPRTPATGPSAPSPTRTATLGWSRRSPRGCPAAPTPRAPPLRPERTWPARCGRPRWPTAHEKRTRRSHLFSPAGPRRGLARPVRRLPGGRAGWDGPASVTGLASPEGVPGAPGQRGHSGHVLCKRRLNRLSARDPHRLGPPGMGGKLNCTLSGTHSFATASAYLANRRETLLPLTAAQTRPDSAVWSISRGPAMHGGLPVGGIT